MTGPPLNGHHADGNRGCLPPRTLDSAGRSRTDPLERLRCQLDVGPSLPVEAPGPAVDRRPGDVVGSRRLLTAARRGRSPDSCAHRSGKGGAQERGTIVGAFQWKCRFHLNSSRGRWAGTGKGSRSCFPLPLPNDERAGRREPQNLVLIRNFLTLSSPRPTYFANARSSRSVFPLSLFP
jgi:hypothetical protein